jgi:thiamine-phosphate diphosphorylase
MVTDRRRLPAQQSREDALIRCVGLAARAGVHLIQIREPDLDGGPLASLVDRCLEAVGGTRARVLVNDRLDVALAAGAHGVHLPGHGFSASRVRIAVPSGFLIGRSVHHASEAARVAEEGAVDYLVFGSVYPTASKAGIAPAGVAGLAAAVAAVSVPVLAIGGITAERMPDVSRSGAAGIAAIGMFADACTHEIDSLQALVAELSRRW